jgi:hypothetical protein
MVRTKIVTALAGAAILLVGVLSAAAEEERNPNLAKALSEATVTLGQGLKTSEREGKPISGKYELEDGILQLSIYVVKGDRFNEVIIDPQGGSIKRTEPITDEDELEEAKEQQQRLAHARIPLDRAVGDAVRNNNGYRAVEVMPTVDRAGKPVASVTLMKGDDVKEAVAALE